MNVFYIMIEMIAYSSDSFLQRSVLINILKCVHLEKKPIKLGSYKGFVRFEISYYMFYDILEGLSTCH